MQGAPSKPQSSSEPAWSPNGHLITWWLVPAKGNESVIIYGILKLGVIPRLVVITYGRPRLVVIICGDPKLVVVICGFPKLVDENVWNPK